MVRQSISHGFSCGPAEVGTARPHNATALKVPESRGAVKRGADVLRVVDFTTMEVELCGKLTSQRLSSNWNR